MALARSKQLRSVLLPVLGMVSLACLGCGDGKIKTYPVTGQVLVGGEPADGAMVIFAPVSGSEKFMRERPWAETGGDGKFTLATFHKGDGAPAGEYNVAIRWPLKTKSPPAEQVIDERDMPRSFDRLRGRYMRPDRSGLTAVVEATTNELPPFELEAPPTRRRR